MDHCKTLIVLGALVAAGLTVNTAGAQQSAGDVVDNTQLLPPAKPGECYARVFVPPTYRTEQVQVLVREESHRMEISEPVYAWAEEQVLVKEGYEKLELVPAQYGWVDERVLVSEASTKLKPVNAEYTWQEERVLDQPAHTVWKKGRNPLQPVGNSTGEIMCLVEVPATYKTVKKQLVKNDASTTSTEIPAEYKTLRKRVLKSPETVRKIQVPAEYKVVRVRKLVTPPQATTITIPAEHKTVTKREKVSNGELEWRAILCETNMRPGLVGSLQQSLKQAGHNPGPIDGVFGHQTMEAVESYQRAKNLATGGLTMETLESLGVSLGG